MFGLCAELKNLIEHHQVSAEWTPPHTKNKEKNVRTIAANRTNLQQAKADLAYNFSYKF